MPFGKYKGTKMSEIPAKYLFWLLDNGRCGRSVAHYIFDNYETLKQQMKDEI